MQCLNKKKLFMVNTVLFKIPAFSMFSGSGYRYMHKLLKL